MTAPRVALDEVGQETARLLCATAEELWDAAHTILATGAVCADDWELARASLSHALAALATPAITPTARQRTAFHQAGRPA